ncbi:class F sortase [Asanoa sp. NPDC050611]|uniref:class F sortase n=1 Tax=Asanoa sp. NPDC050611 TaxID=3157098 RepID=UPI0034056F84
MSGEHEQVPVVRDLLRLPGASAPPPPPVTGVRLTAPATPRKRSPLGVPGVVVLVLLGVFLAGLGLGQATGGFSVSLPNWFGSRDKPPPREFPVLEPSRPTRITIASIGVDAPVHDVGLARDGTIEVPPVDEPNETGWYEDGPTPGEFGPAVLVGHVDTKTGPAVFAKLSTLDPGDRVEVSRRDGSVAVFEVNSVERYDKSEVPADRVHGDFSRPGLRLITCGGRWVGGATGYADNIVVFASLVSAHEV